MSKLLNIVRNKFLRLLLGNLYHPNFFSAEKKVSKKIPAINARFSLGQRMRCFLSGFNSDKLVWYDWDTYKIVISGKNIYLQELNYNPDIYLGQILKPLLLDKRVKEFYDYYVNKK